MTQNVVGYRVCRIQRYTDGRFFTLPADNFKLFETEQQAMNHLRTHHAIRSMDSFFGVQAVYDNGTVQQTPDSGFEPQPTPPWSSRQEHS